jgi:AraC-like DNA-binding protein
MMSPEWAFEVVTAAQRFICATWEMDLAGAPAAARRFCEAVSVPPNLAARAFLRSTLIELSAHWGYACHAAASARCLAPNCVPASLAGLMRTWVGSRGTENQLPSEREIFVDWVDRFCLELSRTHRENLAQRAAAIIRAHLEHPLRIDEIAAEVAAHPSSIRRAFQREYHMSLRDYRRQVRVEYAESLLRFEAAKIEPVALAVGWRSRKDLYLAVRRIRGCTPGDLRRTSRADRFDT